MTSGTNYKDCSNEQCVVMDCNADNMQPNVAGAFHLSQVMQDSLGGNAKTLMIVNISPSECNLDETLTSLV